MRSGSSMVVMNGPRNLGDIVSLDSEGYAYAERDLGKYIQDAKLSKQKSKTTCTKNTTYGWTGNKLWVDKGCRADFDVSFGAASTAGTFPDYAGKDLLLQTMIQKIQSCQISAQSAVPSSWILSPPAGTIPADVRAAWDSYSLRLNSELPAARETAGVFCSAGTNAGSGTATQPVNYGQPTCGFNAYGQPLPCTGQIQYAASAIVPTVNDLYGGGSMSNDIYTPSGTQQVNYPEGGTGIVTNPFAPPAASSAPAKVNHTRRTAGIAIGGVLLLGIAVFAVRRRSKSRRSR